MSDAQQTSSIHGASLILVVNDTGGQGRTTVSAMITILRRQKDPSFRAVAADTSVPSKLKSLISKVIDLADAMVATSQPGAPYHYPQYWDPLGAALSDADATSAMLVDIGANLARSLLGWSDLSGIIELAPSASVDLIVVVTADSTSLGSALALIQAATQPRVLPLRSVIVLANEWPASFDIYRGDKVFSAIAEAARTYGPGILTIPRCTSSLLGMAERGKIELEDLIYSDYRTIAHKCGLSVIAASRELRSFQTWVTDCRASFSHAGLLAAPPAPQSSNRNPIDRRKGSEID